MLLVGSLLVCLCDAFVAAAAAGGGGGGEKLHCTSIGRDAGRLPSELN